MPPFRCVAIPTETAARWRATGRDDRAQVLHRRMVDGPGFPCRHCLRLGELGETMLLGSYDADKMCLYDLGAVSVGREVAPLLARTLEDPRTRFVNIHTARPGCLLTAVERA